MRHRQLAASAIAGSATLLVMRAVASAMPAYNIYPIPAGNGTNALFAQSISTNGAYVAGMVEPATGYSNGVLYNVASGTSTFENQTTVAYAFAHNAPYEHTGVPAAVTNGGIMFGSSGAGSITETGQPTVWQNGSGADLPSPYLSAGGQVYGANNNNTAVGSVKYGSAGDDVAAVFFYSPTNPSSSYGAVLSSVTTTNGGTLGDAFAINDSNVIVGTANDPNNAALTVPFIYNLGDSTASIIPNSSSRYNAGIPFGISNSGLVTGGETVNSGSGGAFLYNSSNNTTIALPMPPNASDASGKSVNDSGEVVGNAGGLYAVPFLYDGTGSYDLGELTVNNTAGAWLLTNSTSAGAYGIADNGDIVGRANYNGALTAFIMVPTGGTIAAPQSLTFNNAGGTGDGMTWDTTQQNWNNGSGATTFSSNNSDNVTFTDTNNGHYTISIPDTVTPGSVTFNNSTGNYIVNGPGGIGGNGRGTGEFDKLGTGTLTLNTVNNWYGPTNIYGGTVILGVPGAIPSGTTLSISGSTNSSAQVIVPSSGAAYAITLGYLSAYGNGSLDLKNNALILQTDSVASVNSMLATGFANGAWNGYASSATSYPPGVSYSGITSSLAGSSNPLMAIGDIVNDNGSGNPLYGSNGTIASTFAGATPTDGEILVKYTYYGDANLDGKIDGSDYSRIDFASTANAAYLVAHPGSTTLPYTGWYNGDFNYDGVINGSDYTLIDNSYNTQGSQILAQVAELTAEVAAVPEPTSAVLLMIGAATVLGKRRRSLPTYLTPGERTGVAR
jgi:autotransporter-associated beta strand protein